MRIAVRGFAFPGKKLVFEEFHDWDETTDMEQLVTSHIDRLPERNMLEIEFLDEPDPMQRFYRLGTDPSAMVMPVAFEIKPKP